MEAIVDINQIPAMIRKARSAQNMTQQQLADKGGLPKYQIIKTENSIGEVHITSLRTIVEKGLGGQFHIAFEI